MFKKTLKQLKILVILIVIIICLPRSIFPHRTTELKKSDIDHYMSLNEKEKRLIEFKDDDISLKLKLEQLQVINRSRKKFRTDEVRLDILASRVANKMSREAAENEYLSHWNLNGEKPYHRYAFAGGYDHISENAFGEWTTGSYVVSSASILEKMKNGHQTFMSERAPNDGHKKTIIDKHHNFVGIGFYLSEKQFRYYEEFIDRYFEFQNVPSSLKVNEQGSITFKNDGKNFPYFLIIFREDFPKPVKPRQLEKKGSYDDFSGEEYLKMPAWEITKYKKGSTYTIPVKFNKEGLYYIQIVADQREITNPSKIDTKGKAIGSGIVIRVSNR